MRIPFLGRDEGSPTMSDAPIPEDVNPTSMMTAGKIRGRLTTVKIENGKRRRVTIKMFAIGKKTIIFKMKTGIPGLDLGGYFVDRTCLDAANEMSWDVFYSEPIDPKTGEPKRSVKLSMIMANAFVAQGIEVATLLGGFIFRRRHIVFMIIAGLTCGLLFISLDSAVHILPVTNIHWLGSLPR